MVQAAIRKATGVKDYKSGVNKSTDKWLETFFLYYIDHKNKQPFHTCNLYVFIQRIGSDDLETLFNFLLLFIQTFANREIKSVFYSFSFSSSQAGK